MNDNTLDILLAHRRKPKEMQTPTINLKKYNKTHKLIKDINYLHEGDVISHIKQKTNYMSRPGIIYQIDDERDIITNKRIIKKIKLMNFYDPDYPRFWELNLLTKKYYIFTSIAEERPKFNVKKVYKSIGGNIADISSNYDSDDESSNENNDFSENTSSKLFKTQNDIDNEQYLLDEIRKYKEQNK